LKKQGLAYMMHYDQYIRLMSKLSIVVNTYFCKKIVLIGDDKGGKAGA
jgi:hypothetical protein